MARPKLTYPLIHAAATDAGNRSMRQAGRKVWSEADWNVAAGEFDRLCKAANLNTAKSIVEERSNG